MMTFCRCFLLILLALPLAGCGDNGIWPTLQGMDDYRIDLPEGWRSTNDDWMARVMGACMAEGAVCEHLLVNEGQPGPSLVVVASNRCGELSPEEIRKDFLRFQNRPVVDAPDSAKSKLDIEGPCFVEERRREGSVTILYRLYTRKGYIEALTGNVPDSPDAIAQAHAIFDGIRVHPDVSYY